MIEEQGIVRAVDGRQATVEVTMPGECEKCEAHDACRRAGGILRTETDHPVRVGQHVHLRVSGVSLLGATSVVYGVPLVALFAGLVGGYAGFRFLGEDAAIGISAGLGFLLLFLAGFVVRALDRRLGRRVRYDIESASVDSQGESDPVDVTESLRTGDTHRQ